MHKIFNSYTRKKFWIFSYIQKQDQVNNANSAFILINCLISRGCQSGSIGPGGQVVRVVRVVSLDDIL